MPRNPYELHSNSFRLEHRADNRRHIGFADPFTGEALSPHRVPTSIEVQPKLRAGIDYLRQRENDLNLSIMGAPHGPNDVHDMAELMRAIRSHDALFLEGFDHTQRERDMLWNISSGKKTDLTDQEERELGPNRTLQLAALFRADVPAYFADLPGDGDDYEQSLGSWNGVLETLMKQMPGAEGQGRENLLLAASINLTAVSIMREWYMIASIGEQLGVLDRMGGYRSHSPLFIIGTTHGQTLPKKLEVLGVKSSLIIPRMHERGDARNLDIPFDFVKALSHCAIDF